MRRIYLSHLDREENSVQIDVEPVVCTFEADLLHLVSVVAKFSVYNPYRNRLFSICKNSNIFADYIVNEYM